MEFTYKIENYIQSEKRLFVVYTPTDTSLPPWGNWVAIDAGMTEDQIKEHVIQSLPKYRWEAAEITAAKNLVNHSAVATFQPAPQPEPTVATHSQLTPEARGRMERNILLLRSDWAVLPDAQLSDAKKAAYLVYRQALRDVPEQSGFPDNITWPTKP
jgi:hypothetical protein